jgi:glyceraldehyde-3-phosphate dehydrogenase (NAD(P))
VRTLSALNTVKELMADLGSPHDNLYEVALWEDMLTVQGDEAFYAYMVDNQAIVIPETIDAIRALMELELDGSTSIRKTNQALGIPWQLSRKPEPDRPILKWQRISFASQCTFQPQEP